jgi:hypothetical protein
VREYLERASERGDVRPTLGEIDLPAGNDLSAVAELTLLKPGDGSRISRSDAEPDLNCPRRI